MEIIERIGVRNQQFKSFTPEERDMIRKSYAVLGEPYGSPYNVCPHDFGPYMSPIEENVWHDIRCFIPKAFLFQYPCGPFFIDFASPKLKVALEVDGKAYHQDPRKDWLRDQYLLEHGYEQVYHIPGFVTFSEPYPELAQDEIYDEAELITPDVVLVVTSDGDEAKNDPYLVDPYQGSEFVESVTYPEMIDSLRKRARKALRTNGSLTREKKEKALRTVLTARDFLESAKEYRKKAAAACFCGKSWYLQEPGK